MSWTVLVISWIVRAICRVNWLLGQIFSWLSLAIVVVCFTVVIQRYFFSISHIWMQDLFVWMSGVMFMGIAGYALLTNQHVRVDVFYRPASKRWKAVVDMVGSVVFTAPFVYIVFIYGLPYVRRSWRIMEASSNYGGMPGLYIVKTFVLVFAVVVGLQAIAMVGRSILILCDREDLVPEYFRYKNVEKQEV
ncbi:MAG: TRAP transporter small permease subunit [Natronospirillum sp.]|uniref:TRAP transporter small permease subunit n=1 Tax=Natronospirillum sp. TaxID=2812955 RepID=UPI0025DA2385|nr:TRAP transporter small permease subunit [Natronospirillum sp.]MCH8551750.1 TRAP transporter small permease subunit [Natronospirillum sp.]